MSTAGATLLTLIRACEGPTCQHCRRGLLLTRGLDWCPQHECSCGHARGAHDQPRWGTDCVACHCTGFIPARPARVHRSGGTIMFRNALKTVGEWVVLIALAVGSTVFFTAIIELGWIAPVGIVIALAVGMYLALRWAVAWQKRVMPDTMRPADDEAISGGTR